MLLFWSTRVSTSKLPTTESILQPEKPQFLSTNTSYIMSKFIDTKQKERCSVTINTNSKTHLLHEFQNQGKYLFCKWLKTFLYPCLGWNVSFLVHSFYLGSVTHSHGFVITVWYLHHFLAKDGNFKTFEALTVVRTLPLFVCTVTQCGLLGDYNP